MYSSNCVPKCSPELPKILPDPPKTSILTVSSWSPHEFYRYSQDFRTFLCWCLPIPAAISLSLASFIRQFPRCPRSPRVYNPPTPTGCPGFRRLNNVIKSESADTGSLPPLPSKRRPWNRNGIQNQPEDWENWSKTDFESVFFRIFADFDGIKNAIKNQRQTACPKIRPNPKISASGHQNAGF